MQVLMSIGVISLILAISVFMYEQKTARSRVIEKIRDNNWRVVDDGELPEDPINGITLNSPKLTGEHFDVIVGISYVRRVILDHVEISDGAFKKFPRDCEIGCLNLVGSNMCDKELRNLSGLTIRELVLNETNITGSSIGSLAQCPGLVTLRISNCDLDESVLVEEIAKLPELRTLIMSENSLSVKTIQQLIDLPEMYEVICYENEISLKDVVIPEYKYLYWQD